MPQHCSHAAYDEAYARFQRQHPTRAAALTPHPIGYAAHFPEFDGYAVYQYTGDVVAVRGVFKFGAARGMARTVLELAELLGGAHGCKRAVLDCFEQVAPAWYSAGMEMYSIEPWDETYRPDGWPDSLGTPDVLYFKKEFK